MVERPARRRHRGVPHQRLCKPYAADSQASQSGADSPNTIRATPMTPAHRITDCVCTYRRPELLSSLLVQLADQENQDLFSHQVVVVDNDLSESAKPVVEKVAGNTQVPMSYHVEPRRNIALARNKAL